LKNRVREKYESYSSEKIVTWSNIISILRAALSVPIVYLLKIERLDIALVLILIAMFTDLLDGWLARIKNDITDLGKILDPLADKVIIFSVLLFLVIKDKIPVEYMVFIFVREFIIVLLGIYMMNKSKISPQANKLGKVSIVFTSITLLAFLYTDYIEFSNLQYTIQFPLLWMSILFMSISLIQYCITYISEIIKISSGKEGKIGKSKGKLSLGLAKTEKSIAARLPLLKKFFQVDDQVLEDIEETLLTADLGVDLTEKLITMLRKVKNKEASQLENILKTEMKNLIEHKKIEEDFDIKPRVILFVGINGTGKTTTIGKLANKFSKDGKKVMMAAADTFRAAARNQLKVWAERSNVEFLANFESDDPAAITFDAIKASVEKDIDVLLVDTAGRLHTKSNLMEELKKIKRVADKALTGAPHEIWLVLDANIGQNGINQANEFMKSVGVTGLILTKLDGTAKGGSVLAIHDKLNIPIKFLGVGEQIDDILDFEPDAFIDALLSNDK